MKYTLFLGALSKRISRKKLYPRDIHTPSDFRLAHEYDTWSVFLLLRTMTSSYWWIFFWKTYLTSMPFQQKKPRPKILNIRRDIYFARLHICVLWVWVDFTKGFTKEIHFVKFFKTYCTDMRVTFDWLTLFAETFFCLKAVYLNFVFQHFFSFSSTMLKR